MNLGRFNLNPVALLLSAVIAFNPLAVGLAVAAEKKIENKKVQKAFKEFDSFLGSRPGYKYLDATGQSITREDISTKGLDTFYVIPGEKALANKDGNIPAIGIKFVASEESVVASFAAYDIKNGFDKKTIIPGSERTQAKITATSDPKQVLVDLKSAIQGLTAKIVAYNNAGDPARKVASGACVEDVITYVIAGIFGVAVLVGIYTLYIKKMGKANLEGVLQSGLEIVGVLSLVGVTAVVGGVLIGVAQGIKALRHCRSD